MFPNPRSPRSRLRPRLLVSYHPPPPPPNSYIKKLNDDHGIDGFVEFYMTESGMPACYLFHPSGQTLEVMLQGATVHRWLDVNGRNLLFNPPDEELKPGLPFHK